MNTTSVISGVVRLWLCDCARQSLPRLHQPHRLEVLDMARALANGQANEEEWQQERAEARRWAVLHPQPALALAFCALLAPSLHEAIRGATPFLTEEHAGQLQTMLERHSAA